MLGVALVVGLGVSVSVVEGEAEMVGLLEGLGLPVGDWLRLVVYEEVGEAVIDSDALGVRLALREGVGEGEWVRVEDAEGVLVMEEVMVGLSDGVAEAVQLPLGVGLLLRVALPEALVVRDWVSVTVRERLGVAVGDGLGVAVPLAEEVVVSDGVGVQEAVTVIVCNGVPVTVLLWVGLDVLDGEGDAVAL